LFIRNFAIRFILAVMIVSIFTIIPSAAEDKIGYIDSPRVLLAHPKYDELQKQLDGFITKKSDEARAAAEKEKDPDKRNEITEKARRESGEEQLRLMNPITEEINNVIEAVAKSKGITIVLNKVLIFYGGQDLTEAVVSELKKLK
jgi:outer membrane protein